MLDTIRIRQAGLPGRCSFDNFHSRYRLLSRAAMKTNDPKSGSELVLRECDDATTLARVGATKVFLKEALEGKLSDRRVVKMKEMATKIPQRYKTYY